MISSKTCAVFAAALAFAWTVAVAAQAQGGRGQSPQGPQGAAPAGPGSARALAPVDLVGYWVSVVTEDWRFRMVTPPKGDYASVPLNAEGRRVAGTWDLSKDGMCEAYGAGGIMRMPGRLHITWEDDSTLKIETDAGQQTRLLHFGGTPPAGGERTLQGYSAAQWVGSGGGGGAFGGFGGFGGNVAPPDAAAAGRGAPARGAPAGEGRGPAAAAAPPAGRGGPPAGRASGSPRWGVLKAVTTQLRTGWLRKNGVPYSEKAVVTENFMRFTDGDDVWFTVTTIVEDPTYLNQSFITSSNFKREPDGSKWRVAPCRAG
jgi:hypothetical protein